MILHTAEKQQSSATYRAAQPNFFMAKQKLHAHSLGHWIADSLLLKAENYFG